MNGISHMKYATAHDDGVTAGDNVLSMYIERYSNHGQAVRDVVAVLGYAREIEPNISALINWYQRTRIRELDSLTPEQLVLAGRTDEVLLFLRTIIAGMRN